MLPFARDEAHCGTERKKQAITGLTAETIMVSCPHWDLDRKTSLLDQDSWQAIRWLHFRQRRSVRSIAKEYGIARRTVSKYLENPDAPKYSLTKARPRPVTDRWRDEIERILEQDKSAPRKQRHTAKRIYEDIQKPLGVIDLGSEVAAQRGAHAKQSENIGTRIRRSRTRHSSAAIRRGLRDAAIQKGRARTPQQQSDLRIILWT